MPLAPTPIRQRLLTFLTPRVQDFVVAETVDPTRKLDGRYGTPATGSPLPAYGTAHPDTTLYPNHKFALATSAREDGLLDTFFYVMARSSQDDYNWEFTDADFGSSKFPAVKRTYVELRSGFTPDTPAMGAAMPNVPSEMFGTGSGTPSVVADYVLTDRSQVRSQDRELDSLFVVDERIYVKRTAISDISVDPLNGKTLTSSVSLYYSTEVVSGALTMAELMAAPTNAFWGLQADGTQRSGKQLSSEWFLVETSQVVSGESAGGVITLQTITSNVRYYWPPVLETFELMDWVRLDGGTDIYPAMRFNPEGYDGPCLCTTTLTWRSTPFDYNATRSATAIAVTDQLQPTRIYYSCPYFTANIPECLHGLILMQCDTGSGDPVYDENSGSTRRFSATPNQTWPDTLVAFDDQEPFRGGYLRTKKVISKPTVPTPAIWNPADDPP